MSTQQIVNYPFLYINGAQLNWVSTTTISVAAGLVRDSANILDMDIGNFLSENNPSATPNVATVINAAVNGVNGLDTGSLANNSYYYVYVIADDTGFKVTSAILSLAAIPLLPFGYSSYRLIGVVKTDGSAHILPFYQSGNGSDRFFEWGAPITVTVTNSGTSATYVAQDLSTGVPPLAYGLATIYAIWDPNAAGDILNFTPSGSTAGDYIVNTAITTAIQDFSFVIRPLTVATVPKIDYKISAGTLTGLKVMGFRMNL